MTNKDGPARRDFLKRSAALGGALVWVTPVVQVVGMRPAFAQTVSPGGVCDVFYAVKIDPDEPGPTHCVSIHMQTNPNTQQCLDVDATGVVPIDGGCAFVTAVDMTDPKKWLITLDPQCEFQIGAAMLKSGSEDDFCVSDGIGYDSGPNIVTFNHSDSQDISNVQLVFCKVV